MDKRSLTINISLVILTRNRPNSLKNLIKTVLLQEEKPDKVIVSDNSSKYNHETELIVPNVDEIDFEYRRRDDLSSIEHYKILFEELKFLNGYSIFLHDDDTLHPKFVRVAKEMILKHPNQKLFASSSYKVVMGKVKPLKYKVCKYRKISFEELLNSYITFDNPVFPGYIYQNSILNEALELLAINHLKYKKYVDLILIANLVKNHNLILSNRPIYYYNFHGFNDSAKNDFSSRLEIVKYFKNSNLKKININQYRLFNIIEQRKESQKGYNKRLAFIYLMNLIPYRVSSVTQFIKYIFQK